uniref:ATP synthase subunit a n=1 Tax=Xenophyes cascus TaxID=984453 RepID=L7NB07_9HEMI|nr:ATP synthase F0 subunit 6 [Xenophyes cascus]
MMVSLFSSFDPSTSNLIHLNWMSSLYILFIIPLNYWTTSSQFIKTWTIMYERIHYELKTILTNKYVGSTLIMTSLFLIILLNNMVGLIPYVFTSTSHIIFPLSFSIPLWTSFMMFNWLKKTNQSFTHLVPEGTPPMLLPLTVMIETMSNLIRPSVIALRLTANMMAGHVLMTLLGNSLPESHNYETMMMILIQSSLLMFEMMVAIVQAYVFMILMSLYLSE